MVNSVNHISQQLFKIIKGFGHAIVLFTDEGKKTIDPEEARRFFAKDIQMMVNFVADETTNEIVVNLSKDTDINSVKPMLNSIRNLANRYIIEYTVKTFGKSVEPKDFAYMAKQKTNESLDGNKRVDALLAAYPVGGSADADQISIIRKLETDGYVEINSVNSFDDSINYSLTAKGKTFARQMYNEIKRNTSAKVDETTLPATRKELEQDIMRAIQTHGQDRVDMYPSFMKRVFDRLEQRGLIQTTDGNIYTMAKPVEESSVKKRRYDDAQHKLAVLSKERNAAKASGNAWKANDKKEQEYYRLKDILDESKARKFAKTGDPDNAPKKVEESNFKGFKATFNGQTKIYKKGDPLGRHLGNVDSADDEKFVRVRALKDFGVSKTKASQLNLSVITEDAETIDKALTEGFSGWHGSARKSINELGGARLIVRHNRSVDEETRGARTRQIESIFIENNEGERFKFPSNNLTAAKAMCRHVKEGGTPFDDFGQYIYETMEELNELKKFQRKNRRNDFFEDAHISEEISGRVSNLRTNLKQIAGPKGYAHHFESFTREQSEVSPEQLDELKDNVTVNYFDESIAGSLPYVARVIENYRARQMTEQQVIEMARYVIENCDCIDLNSGIDADDPELPANQTFKTESARLAAMVEYIMPLVCDEKLGGMMTEMSESIDRLSKQHLKLAIHAMETIKQRGKVVDDSYHKKEKSIDKKEINKIDEVVSKYNDIRKLFL